MAAGGVRSGGWSGGGRRQSQKVSSEQVASLEAVFCCGLGRWALAKKQAAAEKKTSVPAKNSPAAQLWFIQLGVIIVMRSEPCSTRTTKPCTPASGPGILHVQAVLPSGRARARARAWHPPKPRCYRSSLSLIGTGSPADRHEIVVFKRRSLSIDRSKRLGTPEDLSGSRRCIDARRPAEYFPRNHSPGSARRH